MIDTWLAQWGLRLPSSNDATLRLQPAEGPNWLWSASRAVGFRRRVGTCAFRVTAGCDLAIVTSELSILILGTGETCGGRCR